MIALSTQNGEKEILTKGSFPSYNGFLFDARLKMGLRRRKFAKFLGISPFRYRFIENGYLKPHEKDVVKFTAALGIDCSFMREGISSTYPDELPDKERNKVVDWAYRFIGSRFLHAFLGVFVITAGVLFGVYNTKSREISDHPEEYFSTSYVEFYRGIQEKGTATIAPLDEFIRPEISDGDRSTYVYSIIGGKQLNLLPSVRYTASFWDGRSRITYAVRGADDDGYEYTFAYVCYDTNNIYRGVLYQYGDLSMAAILTFNGEITIDEEELPAVEWKMVKEKVIAKAESEDMPGHFLKLANDRLGLRFLSFYEDIYRPMKEGSSAWSKASQVASMISVFSFVGLLAGIFALLYCLIYGERNRKNAFSHSDDLLFRESMAPPRKKDFRITPFLPETFFEVLGIILVAFGSLRVLLMAFSYLALGVYSEETVSDIPAFLLSIQFMGMFLLYFIDFDLFLDDKRVIRNIFAYFLVFIGLYYFECTIYEAFQNSETLVLTSLSNFLIPNNFMSITNYFLLMFFLFFTPRFIKKKSHLRIFRLCSLIPILYIAISFVIGHGDVFFGWNMNIWVKCFFLVERLPYSILAVGYLVGLYFLRRHFKKKMGEENAKRFFNGNRFLFLKNAFLCLLVIAVWIMEIIFAGDKAANNMGVGINIILVILVPLLLFYHPHKGPRNIVLDWVMLFVYFIAITYAYVLAGLVFLSSDWIGILVS